MRLNLDCVRDVLLCVEENTGLYKSCYFVESVPPGCEEFFDIDIHIPSYQVDLGKKYSNEELIYHVNYCIKSDFVSDSGYITNGMIQIEDLTPAGHEFIANIRNDSVWNKVKSAAITVGVQSAPALIELASKIAMSLVNSWKP